jgi:hypothetical protein
VNRAEREQLAKLARERARVAKKQAEEREKILIAETEDLMAAQFSAQDELWRDAVNIAIEAERKANDHIAARCLELGIPPRDAPRVTLGWEGRRAHFTDPRRQAELRRVARTRLAALTATAKTRIDEACLDTQTALVASGLESDEARAFLERMPTAEQLMPALGLDDLGVKGWQPPPDAASTLLAPSTTADRRRRKIRRAIEANPGKSDRAIAAIAGCDHKTVAAHRTSGEFPGPDGESPTQAPGGQDGAG